MKVKRHYSLQTTIEQSQALCFLKLGYCNEVGEFKELLVLEMNITQTFSESIVLLISPLFVTNKFNIRGTGYFCNPYFASFL
ncbi:hypothetical protein [Photobacterium aquae]|uniref:hypothetical protein n=1 Tax=Photobacterium aquae TaxID=1195763 RepID=UPI0012EDC48C|nr:hypothetical protein [Photobacterium aquae]